jgi:hypothetical protein
MQLRANGIFMIGQLLELVGISRVSRAAGYAASSESLLSVQSRGHLLFRALIDLHNAFGG